MQVLKICQDGFKCEISKEAEAARYAVLSCGDFAERQDNFREEQEEEDVEECGYDEEEIRRWQAEADDQWLFPLKSVVVLRFCRCIFVEE